MNYRHAFHAGNFADLLKHAALLWLLEQMQARPGALSAIDTHAGRGFYDLETGGARSAEAEAGVARLGHPADAPAPIRALADAVRQANPDGALRSYPGSPWLIAQRLRADDRLIACELREAEHAALSDLLADISGARAIHADGYQTAANLPREAGSRLVLIDPPFEQPDDYVRCAETALKVTARQPDAVVAIWTPIKDMETFDGFLRRFEGPMAARTVVAELRLRPLTNPMKMNGCAMVVVNAPPGTAEALGPVCDWLARTLGDAGARGEAWPLA